MSSLIMALALFATEAAPMRRLALVLGTNDGGKDRARLRYANTDAVAFARVLRELGGVSEADTVLLQDATASGVRAAIDAIRQRIGAQRNTQTRLELVLYYSGHSDEEGLLLGDERLGYGELRAALADMPVDVKIAILDSCASGALVRAKGGRSRQAFLSDASARARGHAFITSSSADEAAQESDRIAGSFFTHYLVSGMRGAADTTGDKRVTLNEAYDFAFAETLRRTERTQSGPQHPSYDIHLQGSGELVMTDVRSTRSGLVFDDAIEGRMFVRDAEDRLVVELAKGAGKEIELGLQAGTYTITKEARLLLSSAKLQVPDGERVRVAEAAFVTLERERTAKRGDDVRPEAPLPIVVAIAGNAHTAKNVVAWPSTHAALGLVHTRAMDLEGIALSLGAAQVRHRARGAMLSLGANVSGTRMSGLQMSVGANVGQEEVAGMQSAWAVNVSKGRMDGMQLALGANYTVAQQRGVQWSAVFNYAAALSGMQLSTVNVARRMRGVQIGLINVASNVDGGFQLGLINVAQTMQGASLGLFSYVGDVPLRLQIYVSDIHTFNVGLRYGSKYLYGILLGGLQPFDGRDVRGAYGLGLGVHFPFWHLFIDTDASVHHLLVTPAYVRSAQLLFQQRLLLGGQILPRLAVFVGATFNASYDFNPTPLAERDRDVSWFDGFATQDSGLRVWPGFFAGLQI